MRKETSTIALATRVAVAIYVLTEIVVLTKKKLRVKSTIYKSLTNSQRSHKYTFISSVDHQYITDKLIEIFAVEVSYWRIIKVFWVFLFSLDFLFNGH